MTDTTTSPVTEKQWRAPCCIRFFFNPWIDIVKEGTEKGIKCSIVVENFRAIYHWLFLAVLATGGMLTRFWKEGFVKEEDLHIIDDVLGGGQISSYLTFRPTNYVVPFLWLFPMLFGITYHIMSMIRICLAYEEGKISLCTKGLLCTAYIYCILSFMWFIISCAVFPDRSAEETMILNTLPILNLKTAHCVVQVCVVWFGENVAWNNLDFSPCLSKKAFIWISRVQLVLQLIAMLVSNIMMVNAMGDMGSELKGKGIWWNVHEDTYKVVWKFFNNIMHFAVGVVAPGIQAQYLTHKGIKNISGTHALTFYVTDNRMSNAK